MLSLDLFHNITSAVDFPAGSVIFRQGDPGEEMYLIKEGVVEIQTDAGFVAKLEAGDIFGEMSLIGDEPRSATAAALTDCSLIPVDEERFLFLVQQTPYFSLYVMSVLAKRLRLRDKKDGSRK